MLGQETKILLVDDFEMTRTLERSILTELGFNLVEDAVNGLIAKEMLLQGVSAGKPFGLVLCDWNMPVMTGLELLVCMRGDKALASIPFIMVTAETESTSIVSAIDKGANDYLIKPFTKEAFLDKFGKLQKRLQKLA